MNSAATSGRPPLNAKAAEKTKTSAGGSQQRRQPYGGLVSIRQSSFKGTIRGGTIDTPKASSFFGREHTAVYIRDPCYSWLPAKLLAQQSLADSGHDSFSDLKQVQVEISLPHDWSETTVVPPKSKLNLDAPPGRDEWVRTVALEDYPNNELPLQNLTLQGGFLNKSDMADLPFLHEAAILFNLKGRHHRGIPYTRVGDIVVAMNPFRWIQGLYSTETQELYATHFVWNVQKKEKKDDGNEEDDDSEVEATGNDEDYSYDDYAQDRSQHDRSSRTKKLKDSTQQDSEHSLEPLSHETLYERLGINPHIYETSSAAYRGLALGKSDQTILVSGESGAGKTETVKIVMSFLAHVEQTRPFAKFTQSHQSLNSIGAAATVERILKSNPVFEAFGNAKTIRNDNSSRFGKFTQLQYDVENVAEARKFGRDIPTCLLAGSNCTTYLLEKSRVVSHSQGERTYHIFYHLLAAPDDVKKEIWSEGLPEGVDRNSFLYTATVGDSDGNDDTIEGVTDAEAWYRTREALKVFTIEGESLWNLMRALCVVMQLGNLAFDHDPASDIEEGGTIITNRQELSKLANLMGITPEALEKSMTSRFMKTRYDEVTVQLRPEVAKEGCDALAKEIYARVFDYLVRKINEYTHADVHYKNDSRRTNTATKPRKFGLVQLLDIFGFERFKVNRFEQLCINYANERLQHKYVLDNFKAVQQEYEAEGIEIFDFGVVDNSEVLDLLEGKIGLIVSLNEECVRPKGNDASFVYKIKMVHADSQHLIQAKLHRPTEFGVNHFAGPVTYDATKFVERNTDKLPQDLMNCACTSTNELIRDEFTTLANSINKSKSDSVRRKSTMSTNHTVLTNFRSQLTQLMKNIEDTHTRYIRCIKPNDGMRPGLTDHFTTMRQLECAGLVTAITISRESFPNRLGYDATKERFHQLLPHKKQQTFVEKSSSTKSAVAFLLEELLKNVAYVQRDGTKVPPYACGKTRVYFRSGALERLEADRMEFFTYHAIQIQKGMRMIVEKKRYQSVQRAVLMMESFWRCHSSRRRFVAMRRSAIVVQCVVRVFIAKQELRGLQRHKAATVIQTRYRATKPRLTLLRWRSAAEVIQRAMRNKMEQSNFNIQFAETVEEAKMDHKLSSLQKEFDQEKKARTRGVRRSVDESLLEEIETMFDYLRKEIHTLRGKNSDLRGELRDAETDKRDLLTHAEAAEAAASLAKLRVSKLTKTNTALITEVMGHKQEISGLKKELRRKQSSTREEANEMKRHFEGVLFERENEVEMLKENLKTMQSANAFEIERLKEEQERMEHEHMGEVHRLKEELRRTQDSHHDYLAKLMDVLETTHAARENETARINAELSAVKEEKEREIKALNTEVEKLRRKHVDEASTMKESLKLKKSAITDMRSELERAEVSRTHRSQKFGEVFKRIEAAVLKEPSQTESDSGRGSLLRRKRRGSIGRQGSGDASSPDEAARLRKLLKALKELYEMEEESHTKVDNETLRMMDEFLLVAEPNKTVRNLQESLKSMELETIELKKELEEANSGVCMHCGTGPSSGSGRHGVSRQKSGRNFYGRDMF